MTLATQETKVSPMMAQWHACKQSSKDAVLLFRMGDFYEAFYDDAALLSKELNLTLTKRQGIPMSGVPNHACENYIDKLVNKGYRVAIAEQMEDPRNTKGIVKREVVRVVTPGTLVTSSLLTDKRNNYFASVTQVGSLFGLAFVDITTAEFKVIELEDIRDLLNTLYRLRPAELLTSIKFKDKHQTVLQELKNCYDYSLNAQENWIFDHQPAYDFLIDHFKVHNLDGFGLKGMVTAINAAGALLYYLRDHLCLSVDHIKSVHLHSSSQHMSLDHITLRNLELTEALHNTGKQNTLLQVLDHTSTSMGGRMLHQWIKHPLLSVEQINERHDAIDSFINHRDACEDLTSSLNQVYDLERLMMRICTGYASPRDLLALRLSLEQMPKVKNILQNIDSPVLQKKSAGLENLKELTHYLSTAIVDNPPIRLNDGNIFCQGFNKELDELRLISKNSKAWITNYQEELRQKFDIKNLKVGYSRAFGYYIDVSKGQANKMPDTFQRRQTLVNNERFISPELKDYETKVLSAEDRIAEIESRLFHELRHHVSQYNDKILVIAHIIAEIDCLLSLAIAAQQMNYVRPVVDNSTVLEIKQGRHPIIESVCLSEAFVPNDTTMDTQNQHLLVITGPNMAGKSTYIRQVALIVIMAHMGSFVPAAEAYIGITDKVFTRIGASDDLSRGQSTFMVEMAETANILNNTTNRSLVILDEIGRGTSTYDGISIAWAVAEYLLTRPGKMAKTLFATHYWELTRLEERLPGAINYNVAVQEYDDNIVFLRKIVRGDADKSYGIHVAQLAGLPPAVIERAQEILQHLEENANTKKVFAPSQPKKVFATKIKNNDEEIQLLLFEPTSPPSKKRKSNDNEPLDEIVVALKKINLNDLTPIEAMNKLVELQKLALKK